MIHHFCLLYGRQKFLPIFGKKLQKGGKKLDLLLLTESEIFEPGMEYLHIEYRFFLVFIACAEDGMMDFTSYVNFLGIGQRQRGKKVFSCLLRICIGPNIFGGGGQKLISPGNSINRPCLCRSDSIFQFKKTNKKYLGAEKFLQKKKMFFLQKKL